MEYFNTIIDTIGRTPLVKLNHLNKGLEPLILMKVEFFNPGGSIKDRIGISMIQDALKKGLIQEGGTIIESTSGNTGLGLAIAASVMGFKCIFTMPDKMSAEKINVLKAFGAEVIVTPTAVEPDDPRSYYSVAKKLGKELPNALYTNQYYNDANPQTHYLSTGPEIWKQTEGKITHFLAGMGTGGTISGTGKYLKEQNPHIKVIGADPIGSLYHQFFKDGTVGKPEMYLVEGIGEDIFPSTMHFEVVDDVIQVTDRESFSYARKLAKKEGILTGGSGGTALVAALKAAESMGKDDVLVVIIPDSGGRYLSKVFNEEWLKEHQMLEPEVRLNAEYVLQSKPSVVEGCISIDADELVFSAINKMKEVEISQIPVKDQGKVVGTITEHKVVEMLVNQADPYSLTVRDVMIAPLPMVEKNTSVDDIQKLLSQGNLAVIVEKSDHELDIISSYDLLHSMSNVGQI